MLLSEFLQARNQSIINQPVESGKNNIVGTEVNSPKVNEKGNSFADELRTMLSGKSQVQFSNHAIKRLESREIDVTENDALERLNKGVELAAQKGCGQSLILVDGTAYIVSVANNKVITTVSQADLKENVFTNIDSTVIV
ncbi:MAG: hypothetical protein HDT47_03305 [Ruminococcaceae bacterium]|nr:hypothetical protein [Oscillospiraceae bacterium]